MTWQAVIGLEVHVQLKTKSKIFSGSPTTFGAEPNTQADIIDLGMPGVLPVLNKEALRMAVRFGLAVNAEINPLSIFARKNYFYPDLPKGYQISQYEQPIIKGGILQVADNEGTVTPVELTRAHLEEDAGKSLHTGLYGMSGIDLNRAGTPLLEVVSEPVLHSPEQAVNYLKSLHALVTTLEICDGNMQEGSFRCDANVSIHKPGEPLGTRVEIKNLNSFKFIEQAIRYEIKRQIEVIEHGNEVVQETRLYNVNTHKTKPMRSKEEALDYRYFPDPDLPPVVVEPKWLEEIKATQPELPEQKRQRFLSDYQLPVTTVAYLIADKATANYFETTSQACADPLLAANWIMVELSAKLNQSDAVINDCPITAERLAGLINRIKDGTLSGKLAKQVFETMWEQGCDADSVIKAQSLQQLTDDTVIKQLVDEVLANSPEQIADYHAGKQKMFAYFVGQVMKASKGKANPQQVNELLKEKLNT